MKYKHLLILPLYLVAACSLGAKQQDDMAMEDSYKYKSKIAMQRVIDTKPLAKQDLVSREALQYAMLDKMNVREERLRREFDSARKQHTKEFLQTQKQQREDFLEIETRNNKAMTELATNIEQSSKQIQKSVDLFSMVATRLDTNLSEQTNTFEDMKASYDTIIAVEQAKLDREKDRENTIRGVVENMYDDENQAMAQFAKTVQKGMLPPSQWVDLEDAKITLHAEDETFEQLMLRAVNNAAIHAGPWNVKWKLKRENEELLYTKFSLDAETTFNKFINNVKAYVVNYNGVQLYFRLFKEKRVLIVSDS